MGRRKIEIKAIKDDRNRSVTFLKRKGGLFKKAHELSVLCSVDVAVFIFGSNKKLYEYSSSDMRGLMTKYAHHIGPNEHKGPGDFSGGGDDEDDEDLDGTPPRGHEGSVEPLGVIPPHFPSQPGFTHLRHHTQSASPPIHGMPFAPRGHTPQPQMSSRPPSRNDPRRAPNVPQPGSAPGPQPVVNGYAYMPQPTIYHPQPPPSLQHGPPPAPAQYQYTASTHPPQMPPYNMEEMRRSAGTPSYPPPQPPARPHPSPPQVHIQQHAPQPAPPRVSPPQPSHQHLEVPVAMPQKQTHLQPHHVPESQTQPTLMNPPKSERLHDRPAQPGLDTSSIRKLPRGNQSGSIFTPIDDNRSILGQHLDSFHADAQVKEEGGNRSQSIDGTAVSRIKSSNSPPMPQRANTGAHFPKSRGSVSTITEGGFTPPSRSNSLKIDGASRPRLRVQIPDEASDAGSNAGEPSNTSPRGTADASAQPARRNGADAPRLPPPSPSATSILSAGATGPPNPFARPAPQAHNTGMNIDTPVSALPSRFLNEFLPSPSTFYPEWNFRGDNNTTMLSPLNFATPVAASGPSFLRDDNGPNMAKRKSPEISTAGPHSDGHEGFESKRIKVDG
ncbi:putative MADS-box MEF2 type transcription factor [Rosellinia necatrix]|uniref:Putative MADS-box MEF2 type transcription factor n=1 Tax=Rosellinia necatrix TaxID=77044 RepID=A0A1W2TKE8_ROSNE|nr:putative MADS-box MEF2 type transcription factor [Rosellinia necatrix]